MLPSIRELHPYLPSSSTGDGEGEGGKSGGDELKKKKRRRQALSCTECKRRKIRCDRNQPCVPCIRRGEQSKCLWNVVEPAEKYVTQAEYDELKVWVEHLEALVERLTQSQSQTQPQPGPPPFITLPPQPKNWAALTFLPPRRYTGPGSPFNPPYQSLYSPYSPYPYSRSSPTYSSYAQSSIPSTSTSGLPSSSAVPSLSTTSSYPPLNPPSPSTPRHYSDPERR
ncbi:uncharacterized protein EV420DRAFT_1559454 [Desarmillaria tabescens]|uniref:Zn(2)-C6 fungal-type domain-containing protein n=1 Tax=Armillaria tabescens TaxID=1929756 RepID=A0AA39K4T6_ARMTA|nr:uncharacterized protein EV420DRAFT_1559454 [Desarmillaria tabescens]KAK0452203.1 hypothetical protein EV420DRAFT_1559454 [Desarmillaria tabescens]